jgi:hypothetical protein
MERECEEEMHAHGNHHTTVIQYAMNMTDEGNRRPYEEYIF